MDDRRSSLPAAALGLAMFLPAFGTHGLTAGRSALAASLNVRPDDWRFGLQMAVYPLASIAALAQFGSWGDRRGLDRALRFGVALFFVAHALLATSGWIADRLHVSPWTLFFLLRALAGFAGGAVTVSANALGAALYPPGQRGRSLSLVWLGAPLAMVVGVPLPDYLGELWHRMPESTRRVVGEPYMAVATLAALAVLLLVPAVLRSQPATSSASSAAPSPSLPRDAALAPLASTWWVYATSLLMPLSVLPLIVSAEIYAEKTFGFGAIQRGHLLLLLGVASVAGGLFSGAIADRIGRRGTLLGALATFTLLVPLLPLCGAWLYRLLAAALGFVSTIRQGPFQALASLLADSRGRGRLSARVLVCSQLGISLGQFAGVALVRTASDAHAVSIGPIVVLSAAASAVAWLLARRFVEARSVP